VPFRVLRHTHNSATLDRDIVGEMLLFLASLRPPAPHPRTNYRPPVVPAYVRVHIRLDHFLPMLKWRLGMGENLIEKEGKGKVKDRCSGVLHALPH
jgi:hypothetical protein